MPHGAAGRGTPAGASALSGAGRELCWARAFLPAHRGGSAWGRGLGPEGLLPWRPLRVAPEGVPSEEQVGWAVPPAAPRAQAAGLGAPGAEPASPACPCRGLCNNGAQTRRLKQHHLSARSSGGPSLVQASRGVLAAAVGHGPPRRPPAPGLRPGKSRVLSGARCPRPPWGLMQQRERGARFTPLPGLRAAWQCKVVAVWAVRAEAHVWGAALSGGPNLSLALGLLRSRPSQRCPPPAPG